MFKAQSPDVWCYGCGCCCKLLLHIIYTDGFVTLVRHLDSIQTINHLKVEENEKNFSLPLFLLEKLWVCLAETLLEIILHSLEIFWGY